MIVLHFLSAKTSTRRDTGMVTGRCFRSKRLGVSCWTRGYAWRLHLQSVGVGHAIRPIAGLRAVSDEGGVFDVVVNVGGFGQTEEQLVLQALVFATVGASIALGLHTTTLVLVKAAVNSRSSKHQRRAVIVHLNWVCIFLGFHSFGL